MSDRRRENDGRVMIKLQFTPQMFECCIRQDVHIVAQKHFEAWYAECEKQSDKLAKYEKALMIIAKQRSTSEILKDIDEDNATCGCEFSEAYDLLIKDARQALADETKEVE